MIGGFLAQWEYNLMPSASASPRILYVVPHGFHHPTTGSAHRTSSLYQALAMIAQVDVLVAQPNEAPTPTTVATSSQLIEKVRRLIARTAPYRPVQHHATAYANLIREGHYSAVVVRYLGTYVAIGSPSDANLIIDFDDDPLESYAGYDPAGRQSLQSLLRRKVIGGVIAFQMRNARKRAAQIWVSNPEHIRKGKNYRLVPNAAPVIAPRSDIQRQSNLFAFIADIRYPPNLNALHHYCRNIHPKLVTHQGDMKLIACGRFHPGTIDNSVFEQSGVDIVGFVPDISEIYASCSATIAPITGGSGTSVKVMESLAAGVPCIGTSMAYRGYSVAVKNSLPFLIAEDDDDFASKMIFLATRSAGETDAIKNDCRVFAENHWSQSMVQSKLHTAIREIVTADS